MISMIVPSSEMHLFEAIVLIDFFRFIAGGAVFIKIIDDS